MSDALPETYERLMRSLRAHPTLADGLMAIALASISVLSAISAMLGQVGETEAFRAPENPAEWVLLVCPCLVVTFRRRFPTGALIVGSLATAIVLGNSLPDFFLPAAILFYTAVAHGGRRGLRTALSISVLLTVFTLLGVIAGEAPFYALPVVALICGMAISVALQRTTRLELLDEAERHLALTEENRLAVETHAIDRERGRIARELHDVVAHGLATISVQAGGARRVIEANPSAAVNALEVIESTSRQSLAEMRQVLGVLRAEPGEERIPTPGLDDLPQLLSTYKMSGLHVDLSVEHGIKDLPSTVDTSAYRIVQEALTNVLKHGGPGAAASVVLRRDDGSLVVDVSDSGLGATAHAGPGSAGSRSAGHGLIGMNERASVLGGTMHAGPVMTGGYRVVAALPVRRTSSQTGEESGPDLQSEGVNGAAWP